MDELNNCTSFEWDQGNATKNWERHQVSRSESEQVFFNEPLVVANDEAHSRFEARWYALGQTDTGRGLFVVFTIRQQRIRVISARDASRREREMYRHGEPD